MRTFGKLPKSNVWPVIGIAILASLVVIAIVQKNDEAKKLVAKVSEFIPADIIPPPKAV